MTKKLEKLKKLADAMYYAAQHLTTDASRLHKAMDEYHKFIINEYHKEEPVSEDLEKASFDNAQKNYKEGFRGAAMQAFNEGADWHMAQMMKNAVEKEVGIEEWGHLVVYVDDLAVKIGDKVTVIIIKEDEK